MADVRRRDAASSRPFVELIEQAKADIVALSLVQPAIVAIPVADHAVARLSVEHGIFPNECAVYVAIEARHALLDVVENLDDILAAELNDERRDPVQGFGRESFDLPPPSERYACFARYFPISIICAVHPWSFISYAFARRSANSWSNPASVIVSSVPSGLASSVNVISVIGSLE